MNSVQSIQCNQFNDFNQCNQFNQVRQTFVFALFLLYTVADQFRAEPPHCRTTPLTVSAIYQPIYHIEYLSGDHLAMAA